MESDEPVAFNGKGYQWTRIVAISAGRDAVLDLTAANAEVGDAPASSSSSPAPQDDDPSLLLVQWKDSVVAVWTAESRASGFIVDAAGLVVTNQRVIGSATTVEVQLTPSVKVAARVLAADRGRDVAVLWIDPAAIASVRPVPLGCADGSRPPFTVGQRMVAIGAPLRGQMDVSLGDVLRVGTHDSVADFRLDAGIVGGPVFSGNGSLVGISSAADDQDGRGSRDARIVRIDDACAVVGSAEKAMQTAQRPAGTHLPVEPTRAFATDVPEAEVQRRAGNMSAYQMSTSDFDIAFLTPVLIYAAQHPPQSSTRTPTAAARQELSQSRQISPTDFLDWSDYFADAPPVLVDPRHTQVGGELLDDGRARRCVYARRRRAVDQAFQARVFAAACLLRRTVEVTPVHPFTLERRVSESDAIREGLYVFDPQALGPHCKSVKLMLYSEKEPGKPDTRTVDPQLLERIGQDFAPYR